MAPTLRTLVPHEIKLGVKDLARQTLAMLAADYPTATTELIFKNPYQLLVATILSAQSTDKRVNQVTPKLFKQFPNPDVLATADLIDLQTVIRSIGCFRIKAVSLIRMAAVLVDNHGGKVPTTIKSLIELPGVGRKTANVVLGHGFRRPGFPVDRHVLRVSNRLELIQTNDPTKAEFELKNIFRQSAWLHASDVLIQHGRNICKTRPYCEKCSIQEHCQYLLQQACPQVSEQPNA